LICYITPWLILPKVYDRVQNFTTVLPLSASE
jgi:hypothetical protein